MNADQVRAWVAAYLDAWRSNDAEAIGALFATDATYRFDPAEAPYTGREAIVAEWVRRQDEPGTWRARLEPLVVTDDVAIVAGTVDYDDGKLYSNLWVIRFAGDGTAADFTEWYMKRRS